MFAGYFPKFTLSSGKSDDRHGDGLAMICNGQAMLVDGFEGGEPTKRMITWLKSNGVKTIDTAVLTHYHYDHYNGLLQIEADPDLHIDLVYCYDPRTLLHGVDNSSNGRAVKEDIANAYAWIRKMQSYGTRVKWIDRGDVLKFGDITWRIFRDQPKAFTHLDDGNAYAFVNDGSLILWSPEIELLLGGDGPNDLENAIRWFGAKVSGYDVSHHGNNCSQHNALALKSAGCVVAWQSCIERSGVGTTGWTEYGSRRVKQQGVLVWQQDQDILITAGAGKITFTQGGKTMSKSVPYKGTAVPAKTAKAAWVQDSKGWYYRKADGSRTYGWALLPWSKGTNWFYFNDAGYCVYGWQYLKWSGGSHWFYFDETSAAMRTGWIYDGGLWYYLDPKDGYMHTGWIDWKGKKCYLEPVSGRNQGHCYTSCVDTIGGKTYSFDADGYATEISGSTAAEAPTIIKNSGFHAGRNCGTRTEKAKYIVIHYTGNDGATAAENVSYFNGGNRGASAHYFVDHSGEIREYCDPEAYYSWHCGGPLESSHHPLHEICTNRNSIGIEICTRKSEGVWTFTSAAVNAAITLTKYLMAKFGVSADHVCRHYDVTGKSCPRVPGWGAVGGDAEWKKFLAAITTQARPLTDNEKFIEEIGAMARADMAKSGICAAVTVAQAILESGWGKSDLAVKANNIFGMKCSLSGNTWPGSTWDGKSAYNKSTGEYYSGSYTTVKADFRKYGSWAESVADHSAYLAGAKNESALRYAGLVGCTDYRKAAQIIKNGGYATSPDYVTKICNIVEQYNLTRFNTNYSAPATTKPAATVTPAPAPKVPYLVRVGSGVQIYKAPAGAVAKTCPYGVYTIVEEKNGYGKLKSGAGWLKLSAVTKV